MNVHACMEWCAKERENTKAPEGEVRACTISWEIDIRTLGSCRNLSKRKSVMRSCLGSAGRNRRTCKELGLPPDFLIIDSRTGHSKSMSQDK